MPTYIQLTTSNPAAFGSAGQALEAAATRVEAIAKRFRSQTDAVTQPGTWSGEASDAADRAAQRIHDSLDRLCDQTRQAGRALQQAERELSAEKALLDQLSAQIRAQGWVILPNGVVTLGQPQYAQAAAAGPAQPAVLASLQAMAMALTGQIFSILTRASLADVAAAEWLLQVCAMLGGSATLPLNPHVREHLFDGHRRPNKITGYHVRPGGVDGSANNFWLDPATVTGPDANGLYSGRVHGLDLNGNPKTKFSTFFPDSWTEADIEQAVRGAFYSRRPVQRYNPATGMHEFHDSLWEGEYRGIRIQGYLKPGTDWATAGPDDIATAFPVM